MPFSIKTAFRKVAAFPFILYKKIISPLLPKACLYEPSCSVYFKESILRFGIFKGFVLGTARLIRCNGWFFEGGDDPVPEQFSWKYIKESYKKFRK